MCKFHTSQGVSLSGGNAPRHAAGTLTPPLRFASSGTASSGITSLALRGRPCICEDKDPIVLSADLCIVHLTLADEVWIPARGGLRGLVTKALCEHISG